MTNKHDQRRKDALIKTLRKSKEQGETALLYLNTNDRTPEEISDMVLALEHVGIALAHLEKQGQGVHRENV